MLHPGERLLWFWLPPAGVGGRQPVAAVIAAIAIVALAYAAWRLQDPDLLARYRNTNIFIALMSIVALGIAALRLTRRHRAADTIEDLVGEPSSIVAYGLTQHRLLMLARSRAYDVPLAPGEPIIQYGRFRIDRPDRRGKTLIPRIPKAEQNRLFAALKQARNLRAEQGARAVGETYV